MDGAWTLKIDAFTGVFQDCTLQRVCEFLHINHLMEGFYEEVVPSYTTTVTGQAAVLNFCDIIFMINGFEFNMASQLVGKNNLKVYKFSKIRIQLLGKALDFLRDTGLDVDSDSSPLRIPQPDFNLTRVDFAFDFVNYLNISGTDIFEKFDDFTRRKSVNLSPSGRLLIHGHASGIGFSKHFGATERTFYIGSPTSDRVLRTYDKYLERTVANNGVFDNPFTFECSDWTRIEWQLRNVQAIKIFYSPNFSPANILGEIYEFYNIYSANGYNFITWKKFFDPEVITEKLEFFLPNGNFVSKRERNERYIARNLCSISLYILYHGWDNFRCLIEKYLSDLQEPKPDKDREYLRENQLFVLTKRLCEISDNGELSGVPYLDQSSGKITIK